MNGKSEVVIMDSTAIVGRTFPVVKWEHAWFIDEVKMDGRDFTFLLDYTGYFGLRLLSMISLRDIQKW